MSLMLDIATSKMFGSEMLPNIYDFFFETTLAVGKDNGRDKNQNQAENRLR